MIVVSSRRPVGAVDGTWLRMDRPENLMVIESVLWFDTPMDWDRLEGVVRRRMVAPYPVFRQRPVESRNPLTPPYWEDDPDFRLERHIVRALLAAPGDDAALQRYVEAQMHRPFRRDRPLWEMHFVDGLGAGSALVIRLHHALADGIALSQVLLSLTDATRTADLRDREPAEDSPPAGRGLLPGAVGAVASGGLRALSTAGGLATPGGLRDALAAADGAVRASGKILLHRNPPSPLRGTPGKRKLAAWSGPRRLADIKRIARLADATVNDVLIAAVSGAIHTYLVDHGAAPVDLATMVPVNLRPADQDLPRELGNRFALVLLSLPTGVASPLLRLEQSKHRMDAIKHTPEAVLTFGLLTAIGRSHPEVGAPADRLLHRQGDRRDHQRRRPAASPVPGRLADLGRPVLGPRFGLPDAQRRDLQLQPRGPGRVQGRRRRRAGRGEARARVRGRTGPVDPHRPSRLSLPQHHTGRRVPPKETR